MSSFHCRPTPTTHLLSNQPKNHQTILRTPTSTADRLVIYPRRNTHKPHVILPKHSDLLSKIDDLKAQNNKLVHELEAWKSEARAWSRGLGKISPVLRKWLEYQEDKYGMPDAKQSVENRRYMLGLLKERGLLSDKQRRENRGF